VSISPQPTDKNDASSLPPLLEEFDTIPAFHAKLHQYLAEIEIIGLSLGDIVRSSENCRERIRRNLTGAVTSNAFGSRTI
jgi:hypothetical protein